MPLNEADIHAQLFDPKLRKAGFHSSLVTCERFYWCDYRHTAVHTLVSGDEAAALSPILASGGSKVSRRRDTPVHRFISV